MKRKITLLRLTIVIAVLASVGITMAVIPPPPVDQTLGLYDTVCSEFSESDCRSCHSSGVPDTHHMLVEDEDFLCTDCHLPGPSGGVTVIRDCTVCHTATPHHETDAAWARHCSECHGSFVDDYDDLHYIPDYEQSLVTPVTGYRYENATTGKKWGGCEACHEPDLTMDPKIESNSVTHHTAVNNITCAVDNNICHFGPEPTIRKCEDCHGVKSIHNIQYDYENTNGTPGYGHIGEAWDCMGCHAWYEAYKDEKKLPDPIIVPFMSSITPSSLVTGEETVVTILGSDFVTTSNGTTYTSNVDVDGEIIEPDTITATEITVTIPELDTGTYGVHLVKAELRSNMLPLVVAPELNIDSATVDANGRVTVIGNGFGTVDPSPYHDSLGIELRSNSRKARKIVEPPNVLMWEDDKTPNVLMWKDDKIEFTSQKALEKGTRVAVATLFGKTKKVPIKRIHPKQPNR